MSAYQNPTPPPHGYPPPGYVVVPGPPPPVARQSRRGFVIAVVAAVVICGGGAGTAAYLVTRATSDAVEDINRELNAVRTDVTINRCTLNRGELVGTVEITWQAVNSGTRARTYAPSFVVTGNDGTRLGQGVGFISGVAPGERARQSTTVLVDKTAAGKVTCSLS